MRTHPIPQSRRHDPARQPLSDTHDAVLRSGRDLVDDLWRSGKEEEVKGGSAWETRRRRNGRREGKGTEWERKAQTGWARGKRRVEKRERRRKERKRQRREREEEKTHLRRPQKPSQPLTIILQLLLHLPQYLHIPHNDLPSRLQMIPLDLVHRIVEQLPFTFPVQAVEQPQVREGVTQARAGGARGRCARTSGRRGGGWGRVEEGGNGGREVLRFRAEGFRSGAEEEVRCAGGFGVTGAGGTDEGNAGAAGHVFAVEIEMRKRRKEEKRR
jgi:hypothetical protein